jgi:hypothetical protein
MVPEPANGSTTIAAVDIERIVAGEFAENTERKDFTPSDAVAIKPAVEPLEKKAAEERQLAAGERGKEGGRGKKKNLGANDTKGNRAPRAADKVAKATGMDARTLAKAEAIVAAAERDLSDSRDLARTRCPDALRG